MNLFCLPYAGSSGTIYLKWNRYLNSSINMHFIELKGRGKRYGEDFYRNLDDAISDIFYQISNKLDEDYTFFGHSMGALLAYELYYKIAENGLRKPCHMFFSGCQAPSVPHKKKLYELPTNEFLNSIIKLGGIPDDLVKNKDFLNLFLPILRNDFKMIEQYEFKERDKKIECDISIFNGRNDSISEKNLYAWKEHCLGNCSIYHFDGNHFFIDSDISNVLDTINKILVSK